MRKKRKDWEGGEEDERRGRELRQERKRRKDGVREKEDKQAGETDALTNKWRKGEIRTGKNVAVGIRQREKKRKK